jgi:hypothetical protein
MPGNEVHRSPTHIEPHPLTVSEVFDRYATAETWPDVMAKFTEISREIEDYEENYIGESVTPGCAQTLMDGTVSYLLNQGEEPQTILKQLDPEVNAVAKSYNTSGFLTGLGMTLADNDMVTQAIELLDTRSEVITVAHQPLILLAIGEAFARDGEKAKAVDYMIRAHKTNRGFDPEDDIEFVVRLNDLITNLVRITEFPRK